MNTKFAMELKNVDCMHLITHNEDTEHPTRTLTLVLEGSAHLRVDAPVWHYQSQVGHQAGHQLHTLHLCNKTRWEIKYAEK